jgi:hypothetical protein
MLILFLGCYIVWISREVSDVSEVNAASIIRVNLLASVCVYVALCFERRWWRKAGDSEREGWCLDWDMPVSPTTL